MPHIFCCILFSTPNKNLHKFFPVPNILFDNLILPRSIMLIMLPCLDYGQTSSESIDIHLVSVLKCCCLIWFIFCRLKSGCELLIFQHPREFGRKAEELLWRKVFYEVIQRLKQYKRVSLMQHSCCIKTEFKLRRNWMTYSSARF